MSSLVPRDIILNGQDRILDIVPIGEKLGTEIHVRAVAVTKVSCSNLHEREESTLIIIPDFLIVGIGNKQLIGEILAQTAVKVSGNGVDQEVLVVHCIAENKAILAGHSIAKSRDISRCRRCGPDVGVGVVVT